MSFYFTEGNSGNNIVRVNDRCRQRLLGAGRGPPRHPPLHQKPDPVRASFGYDLQVLYSRGRGLSRPGANFTNNFYIETLPKN